MIDSLAHRYATKYPEVEFRYCTAIEAMQRWRQGTDETAPMLTFTEEVVGNDVYFNIESDETIFQQQPFVAIKNIYEEYIVLECASTGLNQWKTILSVPLNTLVKAGVTVCDTMGNQAMEFISYLPDDAFIDNVDNGYLEEYGNWTASSSYSWGTDSRVAELSSTDSAKVSWTYPVTQSTYYNIFIQFPDISNRVEKMRLLILENQIPVDTVEIDGGFPAKQWNFVSTVQVTEGSEIKVEMIASGQNQPGKIFAADVLKITPLVRERRLEITEGIIDFGPVSVEDTARYNLELFNNGIHDLDVTSIQSLKNMVIVHHTIPFTIPPMTSINVPLAFIAAETGSQTDTLEIVANDPKDPLLKLQVSAEVMPYFHTIDNEDSAEYEELTTWHTSVANIYGPTSRYAGLNSNPLASARFYTKLKKSGTYEIFEIVPSTINSTNDALYEIKVDGDLKAVYHIDQNEDSGNWVSLGQLYLPADTDIELWIRDTGNNSHSGGVVIRTDAVRFQLIEEGTAIDDPNQIQHALSFRLEQNYPNPFNPTTVISYAVPLFGGDRGGFFVNLTIYNMLGQKMRTLVDQKQKTGSYSVQFNADGLASGIYYYKITAGSFVKVRKMILMK